MTGVDGGLHRSILLGCLKTGITSSKPSLLIYPNQLVRKLVGYFVKIGMGNCLTMGMLFGLVRLEAKKYALGIGERAKQVNDVRNSALLLARGNHRFSEVYLVS